MKFDTSSVTIKFPFRVEVYGGNDFTQITNEDGKYFSQEFVECGCDVGPHARSRTDSRKEISEADVRRAILKQLDEDGVILYLGGELVKVE